MMWIQGGYTIKEGYEWLLRRWLEDRGLGGEASDSKVMVSFWRKVWTQNLPPKTKLLTWRVFHNSLPDAKNLMTRGCEVDLTCIFCGYKTEDANHIFRSCWWCKEICRRLELPDTIFEREEGSMAEWLVNCGSNMNKASFQKLMCALWGVWACRNELKHGGQGWSINESVQKVLNIIHHSSRFGGTFGLNFLWDGDPRGEGGSEKCIFCDGAWASREGKAGWGVALMEGQNVLRISAGWNEHTHSSIDAEGEALWRGCLVAEDTEGTDIKIVSDSASVVWAVFSGTPPKGGAGIWFENCVKLVRKNPGWRISHILREENRVADFLSRRARMFSWSWSKTDALPLIEGFRDLCYSLA